MQIHNRSDYAIAGRELVAEGADLRVQVLTLAAGQCVPWHYHSEISANGGRDASAPPHLPALAGRALRGTAKDGALRARRGRYHCAGRGRVAACDK